MPRRLDFIVVYDVTNDRERSKVDRVLKGFGFRVQKSVFECALTPSHERQLISQLERLSLKTGSVRLYRRLQGSAVATIGAVVVMPDSGHAYVV